MIDNFHLDFINKNIGGLNTNFSLQVNLHGMFCMLATCTASPNFMQC